MTAGALINLSSCFSRCIEMVNSQVLRKSFYGRAANARFKSFRAMVHRTEKPVIAKHGKVLYLHSVSSVTSNDIRFVVLFITSFAISTSKRPKQTNHVPNESLAPMRIDYWQAGDEDIGRLQIKFVKISTAQASPSFILDKFCTWGRQATEGPWRWG